ncbi:MAG: hypothetical protein PHI34_11640 [Acidobacteriota bacterium]|nr:hypothetical protein [Acidobacteriota bacterium]
MSHSGIVDGLYRMIPLRAVRGRLAAHAEACPSCGRRLAGREEVKRVLISAADLGRLDDIWPAVRKGSAGRRETGAETAGPAPRLWRLAAAAGGLAAAIFLTAFAVRYFGAGANGALIPAESGGGFQLHYARIDERPADTFIVQSPGDNIVLVWVEKNL